MGLTEMEIDWMKIEGVLPALRAGQIVYHGAYAHKLDGDKFMVNRIEGGWMEVDVDTEMLVCDFWHLPKPTDIGPDLVLDRREQK